MNLNSEGHPVDLDVMGVEEAEWRKPHTHTEPHVAVVLTRTVALVSLPVSFHFIIPRLLMRFWPAKGHLEGSGPKRWYNEACSLVTSQLP